MFLRVTILAAAYFGASTGAKSNRASPTAIGDSRTNHWLRLLARGKRGALESLPDTVFKVDEHKFKKVANIKSWADGLVARVKDTTAGKIKLYALKLAEAKGTATPVREEANFLRSIKDVVGVPQIIYPPASAKLPYAIGNDGTAAYHWFVETLAGPDLTTLMVRGDPGNQYINAKQAVRILIKFEETLRHLHDQGFYHGDAHMSNLCIDYDDTKKIILIDFDKSGRFKTTEEFNSAKPSPYRDYRLLVRSAAVLMINMFFAEDKDLQKAVEATSAKDFRSKFYAKLIEHAPTGETQYTLATMRTSYADKLRTFLKSLYPGEASDTSALTSWTSTGTTLKPVTNEEWEVFEEKKGKELSA